MASPGVEKPASDMAPQHDRNDVGAAEVGFEKGEIVTASGHVQELERNFVRNLLFERLG